MQSVGVEIKPEWIDDGEFTEQGGAAAAERILNAAPDVTALFAGNDKMAAGGDALLQPSRDSDSNGYFDHRV